MSHYQTLLKSKPMSEKNFQKKVLLLLRKIPNSYFFKKEAVALRGIPDIIGCVNGTFVALELKKSEKEANTKRKGHTLQKHNINLIREANGLGFVVYPENLDEIFIKLRSLGEIRF